MLIRYFFLISETFELTLKTFQRVDVLVNNAGIGGEQNPRRVLDVNLMGPMIGCQLALKYMGKSNGGQGGMVINIASTSGFVPCSAMPAYVSSKHGVVGLTRCYGLPYHLDKDGVTFAALCPYFIDTPLLKHSSTGLLYPGLDFSKRTDLLSLLESCPTCLANEYSFNEKM
ncbi:15-hydroxyprostaglandin dehydrogenase [Caerostris darwini]|uniref:15-hydroxyprostaglandin dehydrogenase [NAD(+)] n=1 Tax=Caerostris darwini TaxID=1538125 RepID=A0AAV4TR63_9ARAC|nr:15-hydroxyprostaglandin dehydrogenase [Caerostris darwini]